MYPVQEEFLMDKAADIATVIKQGYQPLGRRKTAQTNLK